MIVILHVHAQTLNNNNMPTRRAEVYSRQWHHFGHVLFIDANAVPFIYHIIFYTVIVELCLEDLNGVLVEI